LDEITFLNVVISCGFNKRSSGSCANWCWPSSLTVSWSVTLFMNIFSPVTLSWRPIFECNRYTFSVLCHRRNYLIGNLLYLASRVLSLNVHWWSKHLESETPAAEQDLHAWKGFWYAKEDMTWRRQIPCLVPISNSSRNNVVTRRKRITIVLLN
jgi:hypothetical protein